MYVKKQVIAQVIKLFTDEPKYRDFKYGTITKIVKTHYSNEFGNDIEATCKLIMEIDRANRFIQQHVPALRGKNWLKRQKQGGVISADEYEKQLAISKALKKICLQLEMQFI